MNRCDTSEIRVLRFVLTSGTRFGGWNFDLLAKVQHCRKYNVSYVGRSATRFSGGCLNKFGMFDLLEEVQHVWKLIFGIVGATAARFGTVLLMCLKCGPSLFIFQERRSTCETNMLQRKLPEGGCKTSDVIPCASFFPNICVSTSQSDREQTTVLPLWTVCISNQYSFVSCPWCAADVHAREQGDFRTLLNTSRIGLKMADVRCRSTHQWMGQNCSTFET